MLDAISNTARRIKFLGIKVSLQAFLYPYHKTFHSARFAGVRGPQKARGSTIRGVASLIAKHRTDTAQPHYVFPGRVLAHQWQSSAKGAQRQRVELTCENAIVRIAVLAPDLMRVRISPTGRFPPPFSYALAKTDEKWPPVPFTVEETQEHLTVRTERLHCRIDKAYLSIAFLDPDGTVINADAAGAGWEQGNDRVLCWKRMPASEHIYGLGQKTSALDKRGLAFETWNTDPQPYDPGTDPIYSSIPFYQGLVDGRAYGLFVDNSARGRFDFGAQTPGITRFEADCGELRYYFFYGPRLTRVLERYTELTGRMIMPPLWALGYHQNRWSYYPEARVREVASEFRQRRIPCEAIHLDIDYMDGFRCFTWDRERFPDPSRLIEDLHADGFKVVTMIDPGIKVDPEYRVCVEGLEQDVFCKYPNGEPYSGPVWPGTCHFADFTLPRARAWWGELYRGMVDLGVDGFWNDMNEPAVFGHTGDTFPDIVQHDWEGEGADHRLAHNVYGMQMARATVEGLMNLRPDERPLVISRSLWAGTQRYNMHWLGDNRSDWPSLRNVMQLVLNMGLSGMAFTGPDTGGFSGTPSGELLIRWNQLGAFTPFFRNHTAKGTADQEPWALGETCERISRQFIELRYHLLPYHYTAFWQSSQRGIPMMRPLVLTFQDDPHVTAIDDEFLYGDAFLVAPVVKPGHTSRRIYIPKGRWYDFWEGTCTGGPQITRVEAPIDRIPLFVRAGSVIPAWTAMQSTAECPVERLILHIYPGEGESWLYEDDGHTWAYQEGEQRVTRFRCSLRQAGRAAHPTGVHIERSVTGAFTPSYDCIQVAIHGLSRETGEVRVDGAPVTAPLYDPKARALTFETGLFHTIEVPL